MSDRRYAIYAAPAAGSALARWGAAWLGRDAESRAALDPPLLPGWTRSEIAQVTAAPRHYGFHATLKPPFRLREAESEAALVEALAEFARARPAPPPTALRLAELGGFVALVPRGKAPALDRLADACVESFDRFRAPPEATELARRRAAGLSPRETEHLARWGYPYVFDTFRFHMTLSGALDPPQRRRLVAALEPTLAPILAEPLSVADLALFRQRDGAPFELMRRFRFDP